MQGKPTNHNPTTFVIPTIRRDTLDRAIESVQKTGANYLVGYDDSPRIGESEIRNGLIWEVDTPWVSFLDDDDTVTEDYVRRLEEEIKNHPEADIIHFRQYWLRGLILPTWTTVEWGNVGIAYSVKTEVAKQFPFKSVKNEDWIQVKEMVDAGKKLHFSPYITYRVRH